MKEILYKITDQDFEIPIWEYESVDEADKHANRPGAGCEEMNKNLRYRGSFQTARNVIWETLEKVTGVPPYTAPTGKKTEDGKDVLRYTEKEEQYFARSLAESNLKSADVQPHITKACKSYKNGEGIRNDIRERERVAKLPPKLAEKWLTHAKAILKKGQIEELNRRLSKQIGKTFETKGTADEQAVALGWLVKEFSDSLAEQTVAKLSV